MAVSGRKLLHLLLLCMTCTVISVQGRPMIDTSDIVKDIRDIENILNEAESDNTGDNDDDAATSDSESNEEEEEEADDPGKEDVPESSISNESAAVPAASQNSTTGTNSSTAEPTVTDVSNSTAVEPTNTTASSSAGSTEATKNADIPSNTTAPAASAASTPATAASTPAAADATKNTEVPSNVTESAPAAAPAVADAANATAPVLASNDTAKPGTRDVIGIGQRLTSEQKDTPPEEASAERNTASAERNSPMDDSPVNVGAPLNPPALASATNAIQSAADLMNYTAAAILGQKDTTAKPESSGASPGLYVSEPPKIEEVKIKTATAEKTDVEEEDDSDEKDEASEAASKDESKSKSEEAQNQKKDVAVARKGKVNEKSVSNVANNKTSEENEEGDDDSEEEGDEEEGDDNGDDDDEGEEESTDKENASEEDHEVAIEEQDVSDERAAAVEEEINGREGETHHEEGRVKMFFISPYEDQPEPEVTPQARQILTYPATTGHGWGHSHQWGPAHIWNSDYPYYAYGYSWGCGGTGGQNSHGTTKKSNIKSHAKGSKSEKEEKTKEQTSKKKSEKGSHSGKNQWICRDYMLVPAAAHGPFMPPTMLEAENGVARGQVHGFGHDIACHEDDQNCKQRQVIGSMAGGSMFGDGMGGLGMGFPGVPGIHAGLSGYNAQGGLGDHKKESSCHGSSCGFHGGNGDGYSGGSYGGGGGGGGFGDYGGHNGGGGFGGGMMNRYITSQDSMLRYQPSFEDLTPREMEPENSVKKSYDPRESYENYDDVGDAGPQFTQDEPDERMNEKIFRKFGDGRESGEYQGNNENIDDKMTNNFEDTGDEKLQLDKEYMGKLSSEGVNKAVRNALHSEKKLGLGGHISINGINKDFAYKSKIRKPSSRSRASVRQDIAMPDEQAMMEITKQRQLIGSLGASTLFSDNVGGIGLGHPGIPGMSSGISGIPGEYGGNGGFSHGWNGESQPGMHPHGFQHSYAYGNNHAGGAGVGVRSGGMEREMERGQQQNFHAEHQTTEETGQRRTMIYPPEADYGQAVRNMQQGPMVVEDHSGPAQNQKMSEIQRMVHDVSKSIDKTSKKLATIQGGKRQITPAFTPVVSEPAAVPDIRYPVPSADRYPLGAGYIWPSANYGHQYGGPYAWSKSSTPKKEDGKKTSKSSKSKVEKKKGKSKVAGKENKKVKNGSKKAKIHPKKEKRSSEKHESKHHKTQKRQYLNRPYEERRTEIYGSPFHSNGMEQGGEQPAGEQAGAMPSFAGAGGFPGGGQPSIVGGSSSAMYYPGGGQPIPTYGSDLRGLSMEAYGAAAKRTHVPQVHHHKDRKHKE